VIDTNLNTGFHVLAKVFGADLQHELGGDWSFRNNARYTRYDVAPHSVFNGPNSYLVRASNRLDPKQSSDVAELLKRFGGTAKLAYAGTGQIINDPSTLNAMASPRTLWRRRASVPWATSSTSCR
jgi:hypothetical protein